MAERVTPVLVVALRRLELLEGDLHVMAVALAHIPNDLIPLVPLLQSQDVFFLNLAFTRGCLFFLLFNLNRSSFENLLLSCIGKVFHIECNLMALLSQALMESLLSS